ncbi:MAG: cytochrome c [Burkholderiales bacterium]|nr:cytochrome c [Burkholderiales bacterium]
MKRVAVVPAGLLCLFLAAPAASQEPVKGDAQAGSTKKSMCEGCHGIALYSTAYPEVYRVPKIGGQSQQYLVHALRGYRSGERKHPSMLGIAKSLSDQDMADLAAYYGAAAGAGR